MNTAMPSMQRGLTFSGFLFGAVILIFASITAFKLIPAYMQDATIKNIFVSIVNDPEMQKASPSEIRLAFNKRASIDDVKAIAAEDIEIAKDGERLALSANYSVTLPLAGNISLLLDFNPSSD